MLSAAHGTIFAIVSWAFVLIRRVGNTFIGRKGILKIYIARRKSIARGDECANLIMGIRNLSAAIVRQLNQKTRNEFSRKLSRRCNSP